MQDALKGVVEKRTLYEKPEFLERNLLILSESFGNMYTMLHKDISSFTTNINEYIYYYSFLYPHFIEPTNDLHGAELNERLKKPLVNKKFKDLQ